jgi:hypothetical protein
MMSLDSEIASGRAVRPQVVRDHPIGNEAVILQEFSHQFQRGMLVSLGLDQHIEDFALGVDGAPQIDHAAGDFQIELTKMPAGARLGATLTQVRPNQSTGLRKIVFTPTTSRVADEKTLSSPKAAITASAIATAEIQRP